MIEFIIGLITGVLTGILIGILIVIILIKPHKRGADYYFEKYRKNKTARRP
jgi:NhaP-type Na+/H+ or K+/H+ antiporter